VHLDVIESSHDVAGYTNSEVVAVEIETADAVETKLFQKWQHPLPQAHASLLRDVGPEESVLVRLAASNSGDGLVDAAAEHSEVFEAQVDLERSE
jgi:hypothetical protein